MKILHQAKTGTNDLIIWGKKKKVEYEYIGKHMGEEKKNSEHTKFTVCGKILSHHKKFSALSIISG